MLPMAPRPGPQAPIAATLRPKHRSPVELCPEPNTGLDPVLPPAPLGDRIAMVTITAQSAAVTKLFGHLQGQFLSYDTIDISRG